MKEFLFVFRRSVESNDPPQSPEQLQAMMKPWQDWICLLYTSDAADERSSVDLGGRRIIKKKKHRKNKEEKVIWFMYNRN